MSYVVAEYRDGEWVLVCDGNGHFRTFRPMEAEQHISLVIKCGVAAVALKEMNTVAIVRDIED